MTDNNIPIKSAVVNQLDEILSELKAKKNESCEIDRVIRESKKNFIQLCEKFFPDLECRADHESNYDKDWDLSSIVCKKTTPSFCFAFSAGKQKILISNDGKTIIFDAVVGCNDGNFNAWVDAYKNMARVTDSQS